MGYKCSLCEKKDDDRLGFHDFEAFNDTMLAKKIWSLLYSDVACLQVEISLLFMGDNLNVALGLKPGYTWCSLWGPRAIILKGC